MKHPTQLNEEKLVCGGGGVAWMNECTHQGNEGSLTSDKSFFFFLPAVLTTWNGKNSHMVHTWVH